MNLTNGKVMNEKEDLILRKMEEGETVFLRMFQDGGFQVHKYNYEFLLYEIPQYGGAADFVGCFPTVEKLIDGMNKRE